MIAAGMQGCSGACLWSWVETSLRPRPVRATQGEPVSNPNHIHNNCPSQLYGFPLYYLWFLSYPTLLTSPVLCHFSNIKNTPPSPLPISPWTVSLAPLCLPLLKQVLVFCVCPSRLMLCLCLSTLLLFKTYLELQFQLWILLAAALSSSFWILTSSLLKALMHLNVSPASFKVESK